MIWKNDVEWFDFANFGVVYGFGKLQKLKKKWDGMGWIVGLGKLKKMGSFLSVPYPLYKGHPFCQKNRNIRVTYYATLVSYYVTRVT